MLRVEANLWYVLAAKCRNQEFFSRNGAGMFGRQRGLPRILGVAKPASDNPVVENFDPENRLAFGQPMICGCEMG